MRPSPVAIVVAVVVIWFVGYPLLRKPERSRVRPSGLAVDDLMALRATLRQAMAGLDADWRPGKLSKGDFHELNDEYRQEIAELEARAARDRASLSGQVGASTGPFRKRSKSRPGR